MAKRPTVNLIGSGYASKDLLNNNFEELRDAFDNTLSLDGSTPNAMGSDLDMNSNDILNVGTMAVSDLTVAGQDVNTALRASVAAAATSATEAATSASGASASATQAALYDWPKFDTIALMAASDGFSDGQHVVVWDGFNGEPETFLYDASSTLTADGALIVDATGMGVGRLISTRKDFNSGAEVIADRRTFPDNTYLTVAGEWLRAVSTGAQLSNAGGQGFVVANPGVGPSVSLFGAKLDLTDDTVPIQLALDAMASVGTVVGEYTPGGGTVHMEYGEARINGQIEFG